MPCLPDFSPTSKVNRSPHIVILGAGASRAAFPKGDAHGRRLPIMADLIELLGLGRSIAEAGFSITADFESLYDEVATSGRSPGLKAEIEGKVQAYFAALELPESATLYDYLVLALRDTDYIATFNWDPFLVQAFLRNREVANLPKILFLHGNVGVGICPVHRVKGFRDDKCRRVAKPLEATPLLYPVRQKNYNSDPFIQSEWNELENALRRGYMLTIFGYSAPKTDIEAVGLMQRVWGANPTFELAQVAIVDTKPHSKLQVVWEPFLCRNHYSTAKNIWNTRLFLYPRRSGEALAMATLQNNPWQDNPFPKFKSLSQLHAWLAPLIVEEQSGDACGKNSQLRIAGLIQAYPPYLPEITMGGGNSVGQANYVPFNTGFFDPYSNWSHDYSAQEDVTKILGNHRIKFGFILQRNYQVPLTTVRFIRDTITLPAPPAIRSIPAAATPTRCWVSSKRISSPPAAFGPSCNSGSPRDTSRTAGASARGSRWKSDYASITSRPDTTLPKAFPTSTLLSTPPLTPPFYTCPAARLRSPQPAPAPRLTRWR